MLLSRAMWSQFALYCSVKSTKTNSGKKDLQSVCEGLGAGAQARTSKQELEQRPLGEHCLLCSRWLAQPAYIDNPGPLAEGWHCL